MPRYFFHIHNSFGQAIDDEGQHLSSLDEARQLAIESARTILGEELRKGAIDLGGRIAITDATGKLLADVPYSDAVTVRNAQLVPA